MNPFCNADRNRCRSNCPHARLDPRGTCKPKTELRAVFTRTGKSVYWQHEALEYELVAVERPSVLKGGGGT